MAVPANVRARVRAQAPFMTVFAIVALSFLYLLVQPSHWRRGTGILAVAMLLAAVLRLMLSKPKAGMLAIRARWFDSTAYFLLGALILILDIRLRS
jgi:hypothetical protein